ncbi:hypothetical protein [Mycoplasma crocodyli]|uniref:Uncharacterized protein n=1 Tax=Mycoplasma crocodyli (strain ATCC 51981 / MP145) TaxID=512564 RepID=D5E512_MYCCM|nr:hypothetical protein [Mycoplasma crocodyli]ADE19557.1 hypothetical protein MCRO_0198 [Mycoplasma crocodyli MP145]
MNHKKIKDYHKLKKKQSKYGRKREWMACLLFIVASITISFMMYFYFKTTKNFKSFSMESLGLFLKIHSKFVVFMVAFSITILPSILIIVLWILQWLYYKKKYNLFGLVGFAFIFAFVFYLYICLIFLLDLLINNKTISFLNNVNTHGMIAAEYIVLISAVVLAIFERKSGNTIKSQVDKEIDKELKIGEQEIKDQETIFKSLDEKKTYIENRINTLRINIEKNKSEIEIFKQEINQLSAELEDLNEQHKTTETILKIKKIEYNETIDEINKK